MNKSRAATIVVIMTAMLCTSLAPLSARAQSAKERAAAGNTAFALDFYREVVKDPDEGNVFFSPYSISLAFALAFLGSRGETAAQIAAAMHFPQPGSHTHAGFQALSGEIQAHGEADSVELRVANALWVDQGLPIQSRYLAHAERYYGGGVTEADFRGNADAERVKINDWVEEQTNDRIKDLLPAGSLTPLTRMVIVNAIYMLATWAYEFDEAATREDTFHAAGGKGVDVPLMRQQRGLGYMRREAFHAAALPYMGGALEMVILLPRERDGLAGLEAVLSADSLQEWLDEGFATRRLLDVRLPRFQLEWSTGLKRTLVALGMEVPFNRFAADFAGISTEEQLAIQEAYHKAFVKVNESGTEAAAATAIVIGTTSAGPPDEPIEFHADHPFVFLIYDRPARTVLFMGRLVEPSAAEGADTE